MSITATTDAFGRRPFCYSCGCKLALGGFLQIGDSSVIYEAKNLLTEAALTLAIVDVRNIFDEDKLPHPRLPENVLKLAPCNLLVTKTQTGAESRDCKIVITDPGQCVV